MDDPGLLQVGPDIPSLLPEDGGNSEQSTDAYGTARQLDVMADLALDD